MEVGLVKKVRSVYRSWTSDSYFSIRKLIHRWVDGESEGKCPRGMSGYRNKGAQVFPGRRIPQLRHCFSNSTIL